ncbi:MAG TPA: hypothetical protein VMI54_29780 [Polyangiaceae bacterium]|nr:hypothetical protein [Polyangiaceae bacterium]
MWSVSVARTREAFDETKLRALVDPARGAPGLELERALAVTHERYGTDFSHARARAGVARGHLIDVILEQPGGSGDGGEQEAAETFVDLLLGEARFEDWIGTVAVAPAPRGGPLRVVQSRPADGHFFALSELADAVSAAVRGIHAGLPPEPLWSVGGEQRWYLFELDAGERDDQSVASDIVLVSTFMPELLKSFLSGAPFASTRFSRAAELFAYLKYENREPDARRALARRRVLEDALDAALVSERSGRVIGSGMGITHSYVNFALDRVAHAIDLVREVLAKVGLERAPSVIEFCDTPLCQGV